MTEQSCRTHTMILAVIALLIPVALNAQRSGASDFESATLRHFQALVRMDTSDPPGNEKPAADYLVKVLTDGGIPAQTFTLEPNRVNVVARLKGNGRKKPVLMMGHTDVVTVDASKWVNHGPFSADREGGYIYGRGTVDNRTSVVAALMTILELKRQNVALDRDVIFLAEAGEEGSARVGAKFMANSHFDQIDAEYCLAEGGSINRQAGKMLPAGVQTTEKNPRALELTARGISGHASRPLESNAIVHLAEALAKLATWVPPISLNDTAREYFTRLASLSSGAEAVRYRSVLDPTKAAEVNRYFQANEVRHAAMLHTTLSPTIVQGGYRINVIPSEARATIDVRILPDEDPATLLTAFRRVVDDPAVSVEWGKREESPVGSSRLDTDGFKVLERQIRAHYDVPTLPMMGVGATDMSFLRAKGVQCYGIGPLVDVEDAQLGFAAHSDQERILESELQRFVRFHYDVVTELAKAQPGTR